MGLLINLSIFAVFMVVAIAVSAVGYVYLVNISTTEEADDISDVIGSIIAYSTLLGTVYYAIDQLFKTINKLTNKKCSRKGRSDCTKNGCQEWKTKCCKHKCRRAEDAKPNYGEFYKRMNERYMAYAGSKWPLAINIVLLILVIILSSISFFFSYPSFLFETKTGVSGTTINVYGIGKAKINNDTKNFTLWNSADIAVPELENVVSFITTKRVKLHQTLGHCSESRNVKEASCTKNTDCKIDDLYELGNGVATGSCLNGTCEVYAWCPIEPAETDDEVTVEELIGTGEYTLHIINHVTFDLGAGRIKKFSNSLEPTTCKHDEKRKIGCPIFSVTDILKQLSITEPPKNGTAISVQIKYRCVENDDTCVPEYSFRTFYNKSKNLDDFNYSAITYPSDSTSSRIYQKVTGIFFIIEVDATIYYRSHAKLVISAAGAFAAISSTEPLAELLTLLLVLFSFCGCFCIDYKVEKWCCKHAALPEPESDSFLSDKISSKV